MTCSNKTASRNLAHIALVVFLGILLIQSAVGLFLPANASMDGIDIVLRSTLSSIFGYLMSNIGLQTQTTSKEESTPRTIGFTAQEEPSLQGEEGGSPPAVLPAPRRTVVSNLQMQTIIIAALGFFCLGVLIALYYFGGHLEATSGAIATVAQYRDIISGTVGALIGLARGQSD